MPSDMEPLARLVEATADFLSEHGELHWSIWLSQDAARMRAHDAYGLHHLLNAFGGMGSINDLLLHPLNGHAVPEAAIDRVNQQLRAMLTEVYELARALSKDHFGA